MIVGTALVSVYWIQATNAIFNVNLNSVDYYISKSLLLVGVIGDISWRRDVFCAVHCLCSISHEREGRRRWILVQRGSKECCVFESRRLPLSVNLLVEINCTENRIYIIDNVFAGGSQF